MGGWRTVLHFLTEHYLLLPIGAVAALLWANTWPESYFTFAHALAFPTAFYQHFGLGLAFAAVFELAGAGAVGVVASAATHAMWNGWLATMPVFG